VAPAIFARRRYARDNYLYLLASGPDAALVDPGDPEAALALAAERGVRPRWILHTHGHADHTGGSAALRQALGAEVLGHGADGGWFAPDQELAGRSEVSLGALRLRVHFTPGHTPGSILLEWEGRLLTGDTLFGMGCGNCRGGGDPARLAASFGDVIAALPGDLEVHPGHDYAERNLPFALALEPDGAAVERGRGLAAARAAGREPDAVRLHEERATNPFLRLDTPGCRRRSPARPRAPGPTSSGSWPSGRCGIGREMRPAVAEVIPVTSQRAAAS
jgi:hydroxyacylglutathione hydrolase